MREIGLYETLLNSGYSKKSIMRLLHCLAVKIRERRSPHNEVITPKGNVYCTKLRAYPFLAENRDLIFTL